MREVSESFNLVMCGGFEHTQENSLPTITIASVQPSPHSPDVGHTEDKLHGVTKTHTNTPTPDSDNSRAPLQAAQSNGW